MSRLKFRAILNHDRIEIDFVNPSAVETDSSFIYIESKPENTGKSFTFSFDTGGKVQPYSLGQHPFVMVIPSPGVVKFYKLEEIPILISKQSGEAQIEDDNTGEVCGCPDCFPC